MNINIDGVDVSGAEAVKINGVEFVALARHERCRELLTDGTRVVKSMLEINDALRSALEPFASLDPQCLGTGCGHISFTAWIKVKDVERARAALIKCPPVNKPPAAK